MARTITVQSRTAHKIVAALKNLGFTVHLSETYQILAGMETRRIHFA